MKSLSSWDALLSRQWSLGRRQQSLLKAKDVGIRIFDGFLLVIWAWICMNGVAVIVIVIEDKDAIVATCGWDYETACLT